MKNNEVSEIQQNSTLVTVVVISNDNPQSQSGVVVDQRDDRVDHNNNNSSKSVADDGDDDIEKSSSKVVPLVHLQTKPNLTRTSSSLEQCRVCQQEKEEGLIDLGCKCRGGLGKAHLSCIAAWFHTKGSNKCEICQDVAANVPAPESIPNTNSWVLRIDPSNQIQQDRERGCFSPLWVAFSILIGGLLLDVLISITLGVSALPINIIIGVIVVLGLGTALRLALEFCHEWSLRRAVQRVETNITHGYHPAL